MSVRPLKYEHYALEKHPRDKCVLSWVIACLEAILESGLDGWASQGLFLEAVSQGQSVPRYDREEHSGPTGDCASRQSPLSLKPFTCGFGGLEGMTGCGGRYRQSGAEGERGQGRPGWTLPPNPLHWGPCHEATVGPGRDCFPSRLFNQMRG